MVDLLEILHSFLTDGITWSTIIAIYLAWHKIREGKQKRVAHERMEQKQQAIMSHLGVPWDWDAEKKSSKPSTGKTLLRYSPAAKSLVRTVWLFIHRKVIDLLELRRKRKMQISKAWIVGLIGYIAFFVKQYAGIEITDDMIDKVSELALLVIMLIPMFVNMIKQRKSLPEQPQPLPQHVEPDKFIQG